VFHTTLPSGLRIDAYELGGPPSTEPLVFVPVSDVSQGQILSEHEIERKQVFTNNAFFDAMTFGMKTEFGGSELIARGACKTNDELNPDLPGSIIIEVVSGDEIIFTVDAGDCSPITNLQGLWSYEQDWILEYANVATTLNESENTVSSEVTGHLVKNGVLLNGQYSYDEIFGFQLLKDRPF
jgi:hypothetical protein